MTSQKLVELGIKAPFDENFPLLMQSTRAGASGSPEVPPHFLTYHRQFISRLSALLACILLDSSYSQASISNSLSNEKERCEEIHSISTGKRTLEPDIFHVAEVMADMIYKGH
jgi:hypothetical protein